MLPKLLCLTTVVLFQIITSSQESMKPRTLSLTRLTSTAKSTDLNEFTALLEPILRTRVPGTKGHHIVKKYIIDFFNDLGWNVTLDQFDQDTVIGQKRFTNIVATANPNAKKFLLLTAHYDSKVLANGNQEFVAATDSGVPCTMIMSIAKNLNLEELKKNNDFSLQMVFFDGEEAFVSWTPEDSIYGSRHLAKVWSKPDTTGKTHLSTIEALILLDLIGAKNPRFYSSFPSTHGLFERLQRIETKLRKNDLIQSSSNNYFNGGLLQQPLDVEDDHVPFMKKGVPILHIIPVPFPDCWHKVCDDRQSIDKGTVHDLLKIFHVFFKEITRA